MKTLDSKKDPGTPLCPFRKETVFMASNNEHSFQVYLTQAEYTTEYFLPCMKEKCMKYNQVLGCGM